MPVEERLGDPRSVCVLLSVEWIAHLWPKYIIVWWCGGNLCCFHCRTEVKCLSVLSWHSILLLGTKDHTKRPKTPLPITLFFLQRQTFVFFTKIKNKSLLNSIAKEYIYSFGCWGHDTHTLFWFWWFKLHQVRCCMWYPVGEVLWFPYINDLGEQLQHMLKEIKSGKV